MHVFNSPDSQIFENYLYEVLSKLMLASIREKLKDSGVTEGDIALMIAYDIHACNMINFKSSKVFDKIGFAQIPGRKPVMGGWNFCVNANCKSSTLLPISRRALQPGFGYPLYALGRRFSAAEYRQ